MKDSERVIIIEIILQKVEDWVTQRK